MAGMVGQNYFDECKYYYYLNNPDKKPDEYSLECIERFKKKLAEQKIEQKAIENKVDDWEWAKKNIGKFKPYFNTSLGVRIESPEQIKNLEKSGTIFMNIPEYEREGKKIKREVEQKREEKITKAVKEKIDMVKAGYSFYKNK
jgi:hypothetical protein